MGKKLPNLGSGPDLYGCTTAIRNAHAADEEAAAGAAAPALAPLALHLALDLSRKKHKRKSVSPEAHLLASWIFI